MADINLGFYRHYKGPLYQVIGTAKHSETYEDMALYIPQYGDGGYWVRPLAMFKEQVEVDGEFTPRFAYLDPQPTPSLNTTIPEQG